MTHHLGLAGDRRSWIILSEANIDIWPSPDLRPVPGHPGRFDDGVLPLRVTNAVRATVRDLAVTRRLAVVDRTRA